MWRWGLSVAQSDHVSTFVHGKGNKRIEYFENFDLLSIDAVKNAEEHIYLLIRQMTFKEYAGDDI